MMRLAQISDVQIRNFQRHDEFRQSFENLYKSLHEKKPDVIVLVGDIAHSKTHISPEFVQICSEFFTKLASIAPLIVVPGNHDANLNNLSRLDALTPIVEALDHNNIWYFKDSGVYPSMQGIPDFDVNWVVFSCFDNNWPTEQPVRKWKDDVNIGLYHGMVKNAVLQNGQVVEDCPYTIDDFLKITDYLMMGDIHKMQFLDFKQKAAYCGSLIQQNFGESLDKGYLLWDIKSKDEHEVDFVKLPNVCPYYVIDMPDDLLLTEKLKIQEGARIRVDSRKLTPAEKNVLGEKIKKKYKPKEIFFKDDVNAHKQTVKISDGVKIEDLSDTGIQNKLIRNFFEKHWEATIEPTVLDRVCELNIKYDSQIKQEEVVTRNVQYKIRDMTWNNILSYGEDNSFNFSEKKGLVGIFGKNACGKSSLAVDIPLYVMFNTNSKSVVKNDQLINDKKETCQAVLNVQVGNDIYKLDRSTWTYIKSGKKKGNPVYQGKTKLVYTQYDLKGNEVLSLDDEQRQDTDKVREQMFGTAEDFLATSVAAQFDLINFISKKDTERQRIIGRYFDVDSFEKKREAASEDCKEIKIKLKTYDGRNFAAEKEDIVAEVKRLDKEIVVLQESVKLINKELSNLNGDIASKSEKILRVSLDESKTEDDIVSELQKKRADVVNKENEIENLQFKKEKLNQRLDQLLESIDSVDIDKLEKELAKWKKEAGSVDVGKVATFDSLIDFKNNSLKKLEKYPCITNKDCCMLEEINRIQNEKNSVLSDKKKLTEQIDHYTTIINEKVVPIEDKITEYRSEIDTSLELTKSIQSQEKFLKTQEELLEKIKQEVEQLEKSHKLFVENKQQIEKNNDHRSEINKLKERFDLLTEDKDTLQESIAKQEIMRTNLLEKHTEIEDDELKCEVLINEYDAYYYFMEAAGKNGISRIIINENLEIINNEIQKILSGKVDFDITLETNEDGKTEIYFKAPKGKKRRIELCSGMEKTITAIAIRAALVSVTTLPKSNIFVLDEVFRALDPEYLDATREILLYLKNLFDSVIIITHIDGFRDIVDHVVEVYRDDQGFSRIL